MKSGKEHECFKNWNEDSQSMEADIILEGFSQAEAKHGVRYMRVVGDGDSSVFARIRQEIPVWGRFVTKEECANHVTKCFRLNLEKLVSENPMYKGKNNLSKSTRVRLVSSVRCSIRMRSKELKDKTYDRTTCVKRLQHDINNSVYHVFGFHTNCSDFCRAKDQQNSTHSNENSAVQEPNDHSIIGEQIDYWTEGTSLEEQEELRFGSSTKYADIEQHIIRDVSQLLSRISEKADRLISNSTTNLAESWMHVRTKFDGGKVHNLCNRGSWHARCYGGALRMNLGPQWSCKIWETSTASEPGYFFRTQYVKQARRLASAIKYRQKPSTQVLRWKKKVSCLKKSTTKKARLAYGPEALDVTEDVSSSELALLQTKFLDNHVNLSSNQCQIISNSTVNQSQSGLWYAERKKRITASNFGLVVKRNPSLSVQKFVKTLLYSSFHGNRHTRNGLLQEDTTIEEYKLKMAEQKENVCIERSGLIIHPQHKYLAGSPDGIVTTSGGESGLIEIKNLLHSKPVNLWQASENTSFCLENSNGKLNLKSNHNYYYQCQGLLQICDKNWIDFIVRTLNPHQLFVQRIYKDNDLWGNLMLPKLDALYHKAMLPELASPRHGKCPGIREPGVWFQPQERSLLKRKRKQPSVTSRTKKNTSKPVSSTDTESKDSKRVIPTLTCQTRRKKTAKFMGRCIRHEWIVNEDTQEKQWYTGTVISLISGCDGHMNAVYEVVYDGEDEPYEIDHLMQDYHSGSVTFADI